MNLFLNYLKPYKKECIIGPFFKLLEAILELLLPTVMMLVIDQGVLNKDASYIIKLGVTMIFMSLIGFLCSLTCQYQAAKASQGYGTDLRNALFTHISSFSYATLDQFGASTLTTRLTNDINQLQLGVAMLIRLVVRAPFICIGAIIMAASLNMKLSLVLIGTMPLFIGILYFIIKKTSPLYRACQKKLDQISTIVRENLSGIRVIRSFSKDDFESMKFDTANDDLVTSYNHVAKLSALLSPLTALIMNLAIILILWMGSFQINSGAFTQGKMVAYINYITQVLLALIVISNLIILYTKVYASMQRILEVMTSPTNISYHNGKPYDLEGAKLEGSNIEINGLEMPLLYDNNPIIEFKNVSFAYYDHADQVLEDINLTICPNQTIGIIGATGSGKTTLVNLIGRFYEVTKGSILINGKDIKEYPINILRKIISYVPQKSVLFSGTIADNLRLGNTLATDNEIKHAALVAQADHFISKLKDGYETKVERGGQNFSGGQRQRLAIARALVANPHILILDDSSSALDFATEAKLRKALKENLSDITVITISQRVTSIKHCDTIFVMDDGQLVGHGTHMALLKNCRIYQEICLAQLLPSKADHKGDFS